MIRKDPELMRYFPDQLPENRWPDRHYMFTILNTLKPEYMNKIVQNASKMRNSAEGKKASDETIQVSESWFKKLHEIPFISCKSITSSNMSQLVREESSTCSSRAPSPSWSTERERDSRSSLYLAKRLARSHQIPLEMLTRS